MFIEVSGKTIIRDTSWGYNINSNPSFYSIENEKLVSIHSEPIRAFATIIDQPDASKSIFRKAINFVNSKGEINPAHLYLRDARQHLRNRHVRHSIIDSCTAIEIAFTQVSIRKIQQSRISDSKDLLLNKFQTLRGRLELLTILSIRLPFTQNEYRKRVIKPRNLVIHGGYKSSYEEAKRLFAIAEKTVFQLCNISA